MQAAARRRHTLVTSLSGAEGSGWGRDGPLSNYKKHQTGKNGKATDGVWGLPSDKEGISFVFREEEGDCDPYGEYLISGDSSRRVSHSVTPLLLQND